MQRELELAEYSIRRMTTTDYCSLKKFSVFLSLPPFPLNHQCTGYKVIKSIAIVLLSMNICCRHGSEATSPCLTLTEQCPSKSDWERRAKDFNCKSPKQYTCILTENLDLAELCMHVYPISKNTQDCPLISCFEGEPFLKSNFKPCPTNKTGCPPEGHDEYRSNELYKFPRCIHIKETEITSTERNGNDSTSIPTGKDKDTRCKNTCYEDWIFKKDICCIIIGILGSVLSLSLFIYVIILRRRLSKRGFEESRRRGSQRFSNGRQNYVLETKTPDEENALNP